MFNRMVCCHCQFNLEFLYLYFNSFWICILETKIIFMLSLLIQPWVARIEFSWQSIIWTNLQFEWHKYKFDSPLSFHKRQIPQKRNFLHINWFFSSCVTCSLNQQVFLFRGKVLTGLLQSDSLSSWAQSHCFIVKIEGIRQMCIKMVWWSYILCGLNQQPTWLSDPK